MTSTHLCMPRVDLDKTYLSNSAIFTHMIKPIKSSPVSTPLYPMRINKYLALKGYSTRRGADGLIDAGKVFINGIKAVLGSKVAEADTVEVRLKNKPKPYTYLAFYKPVGVVTHTPQFGEKEITDLVDNKAVFPLGRLDKDSEGLIILTDDGRITDKLLNPLNDHTKEYIVTTSTKLRSSFKKKMEEGVMIEGYLTKPAHVRVIDDTTFAITLTEGKKHQIRRMVVALFNEVIHLKRTKVLNISVGKLRPGEYREITGSELETFLKLLDVGTVSHQSSKLVVS
jgi:23S rRNA pseudouridine2604 synthase